MAAVGQRGLAGRPGSSRRRRTRRPRRRRSGPGSRIGTAPSRRSSRHPERPHPFGWKIRRYTEKILSIRVAIREEVGAESARFSDVDHPGLGQLPEADDPSNPAVSARLAASEGRGGVRGGGDGLVDRDRPRLQAEGDRSGPPEVATPDAGREPERPGVGRLDGGVGVRRPPGPARPGRSSRRGPIRPRACSEIRTVGAIKRTRPVDRPTSGQDLRPGLDGRLDRRVEAVAGLTRDHRADVDLGRAAGSPTRRLLARSARASAQGRGSPTT